MKNLKLIFVLLLLFSFLIFIINKNHKKNEAIEINKKYTLITPNNIEAKGVNQSFISFYINDVLTGSYSRLIKNSEVNSYLKKRFLIEYDSTNLKNCKIFIDIEIPDSVKIPKNNWNELPNWVNSTK